MNRKEFLVNATVLSTALGSIMARTRPVQAQKVQPPPSDFQLAVFTPDAEIIRWTFPFDTWEFGNRIAYDTAWWWFLDGGSDAYFDPRAIKLILHVYGREDLKINDRNGLQPQTDLRPVPYEDVFPPPDFSQEVTGPITFIRRDPNNVKVPFVIGMFAPKVDDLGDPNVHWYYQGAGVFVAVYGPDVILRLWVQSARNDVSWLSPLG